MAYNNGFPVSYPQYYMPQYQPQVPQVPQVQSQPVQQQPQMNSNLIWVQGEAGAKSYLVAPNTTVQLWDSERQTIYLKSADASGMPSIKTLDYTIREMPQNNVVLASESASSNYATKDEVNVLAEQITALKNKLDGIATRPVQKVKKDVSDSE